MGLTRVKVRIYNPADGSRFAEAELPVDTGALLSMVPRRILEGIGIRPTYKRTFRVADGRAIEREVGAAIFEVEGYEGASPVIFGEEGDAAILGVVSLEAMGLEVDPVTGKLRPMELLLV